MKPGLIAILIMAAVAGLGFAQQPNVPKGGMEIDLPEVVAEVRAAYDRYNNAINSGTIAVLNDTFWNDPRTIRYGQAENLYGYKEIPQRTLARTVITTYGRDFAVASTLTYRDSLPGKVGRQMQTWVRFPDGWHLVAGEVSTIDEPK